MKTPLGRFVLKVLAWLPVAFVVWYFGAPLLLWPVKVMLAVIAWAGLPDLVTSVEQSGAVFTFASSLKPGAALATSAHITVDVDGSHVVMISQPQAVADIILAAVTAVSTGGAPNASTEVAAPSTS